MKNCPKCGRERNFETNKCECGFVFAPGCLFPLIVFMALNVAFSFTMITAQEQLFTLQKEVGVLGVAVFMALTYGLYRRHLWSIHLLRVVFMLLLVYQITLIFQAFTAGQAGGLHWPTVIIKMILYSIIVLYSMRPELKDYFQIQKQN